MSLTLGCPKVSGGRVEANVGRDLRDRKRMAAFTAHSTLCAAGLSRPALDRVAGTLSALLAIGRSTVAAGGSIGATCMSLLRMLLTWSKPRDCFGLFNPQHAVSATLAIVTCHQ